MKVLSFVPPAALSLVLAFGCADEPGDPGEDGDYSACDPAPANNQVITCDSLLRSVEDLCGLDLSVDPCLCAAEVEPCITEQQWLQSVLDCEKSAGDCVGYIDCLEQVGENAGACDSPVDWSCITTGGDTAAE
jgi:hypothetical protein